jgi:hypothetical protein
MGTIHKFGEPSLGLEDFFSPCNSLRALYMVREGMQGYNTLFGKT